MAVLVCGRFCLWPFRFLPFRFVAVKVCGRLGLWPLLPETVQEIRNSIANAPKFRLSCTNHRYQPHLHNLFICIKHSTQRNQTVFPCNTVIYIYIYMHILYLFHCCRNCYVKSKSRHMYFQFPYGFMFSSSWLVLESKPSNYGRVMKRWMVEGAGQVSPGEKITKVTSSIDGPPLERYAWNHIPKKYMSCAKSVIYMWCSSNGT